MKLRNAVPATEFRRNGRGSERLIGANGEFNAGNKQELAGAILALANAVNSGDVQSSDHMETAAADKREAFGELAAAFYEEGTSRFAECGATIAATLYEVADREGFMRRFLLKAEVTQGQDPRIRVREKNVRAFYASGPSRIQPIYVREKFIMPPEFEIKTSVRVARNEIDRGSPELLDEKFFEGQEGIQVMEDRTVKRLLDATAGAYNEQVFVSGSLAPSNFGYMMSEIEGWNLPFSDVLMAADLMSDIATGSGFNGYFEPVSQYQIVMTGKIGTLLGATITTDAFKDSRLRVLSRGEMYGLTQPQMLGAYTERGPVESREEVITGETGRGWLMHESVSVTVQNGRGIVKLTRT